VIPRLSRLLGSAAPTRKSSVHRHGKDYSNAPEHDFGVERAGLRGRGELDAPYLERIRDLQLSVLDAFIVGVTFGGIIVAGAAAAIENRGVSIETPRVSSIALGQANGCAQWRDPDDVSNLCKCPIDSIRNLR
jgi:hypothetical protein